MIRLTRINGEPFVVNCDLIEHIDAASDTIVVLTNGQKFVVTESPEDVVHRAIDYQRTVREGRADILRRVK